MREKDIRLALLRRLASEHRGNDATLILEELAVRQGRSRIDVAVINGSLHGYEIKSDQDNLKRLPDQLGYYKTVFDYVTIVCGEKYLERLADEAPDWCGLLSISQSNHELSSKIVRKPKLNKSTDPLSVAQFLWRDEALGVLQAHNQAHGLRSKPKRVLWKRLSETLDKRVLAKEVRVAMRARETSWRPDSRQRLGDD